MSFFVGCTDLLRVEPENSLTFGNITKEKDVEALVYGVGAGVRDMVCWNALLQGGCITEGCPDVGIGSRDG